VSEVAEEFLGWAHDLRGLYQGDTRSLLIRAREGDEAAKTEIINAHRELAALIGLRLAPSDLSDTEIIQKTQVWLEQHVLYGRGPFVVGLARSIEARLVYPIDARQMIEGVSIAGAPPEEELEFQDDDRLGPDGWIYSVSAALKRADWTGRRVLGVMQTEASGLGHRCFSTAHVLLALFAEKSTADVLQRSGLLLQPTRRTVDTLFSQSDAGSGIGNPLAMTPRARAMLADALRLSADSGHSWVGACHLMTALLSQDRSAATSALERLRANPNELLSRARELTIHAD
jgi:hypothetical protein